MKRKKKYIQTFIFTKSIFKCKKQVKDWLKRKKCKLPKKNLYSNKKEYRVRQKETNKFKKNTLKCVVVCKGIKAMKGYLK